MKTRLNIVLIDDNSEYAERLAAYFREKHSRDFNFDICESVEAYRSFNRVDIFLLSESSVSGSEKLSGLKIVLSERDGVAAVRGIPAIAKYKRGDEIYRGIMRIFLENSPYEFEKQDSKCRKSVFISAAGGVGTTTMAVAYAMKKAAEGEKVLYFCPGLCNDQDTFLYGEGSNSLSDALYYVMSGKNVEQKLANILRQDESGVYFLSDADSLLDYLETGEGDMERLIEYLTKLEGMDLVVLDLESGLSSFSAGQMETADEVFFVHKKNTDSMKEERFIRAISALEKIDTESIIHITPEFFEGENSRRIAVMASMRQNF